MLTNSPRITSMLKLLNAVTGSRFFGVNESVTSSAQMNGAMMLQGKRRPAVSSGSIRDEARPLAKLIEHDEKDEPTIPTLIPAILFRAPDSLHAAG